jgi:cytidylate kinase
MPDSIVIAIDGTSASGKSTNARRVAKALGYSYVDTGAMYRTLAWHCLQARVDLSDAKAVAAVCRKWRATLRSEQSEVRLYVDGYFPEHEIRTLEVSDAVPHVAVMEGRDIGSNVFPETDYKFYLDASLDERSRRRSADGVDENLAARDQRDSQRASAPLMIPLGAMVVNNSGMTPEQTSEIILTEIRRKQAEAR